MTKTFRITYTDHAQGGQTQTYERPADSVSLYDRYIVQLLSLYVPGTKLSLSITPPSVENVQVIIGYELIEDAAK